MILKCIFILIFVDLEGDEGDGGYWVKEFFFKNLVLLNVNIL